MTDIPPNDLSPSSVGESHTMSQEDKKRRLAYFDRHLAVSKNTAGQSTQDANAGGSDEPTSARPVKVWTGADPIVDLPDYKQGFDPKSRLTSKDWSESLLAYLCSLT